MKRSLLFACILAAGLLWIQQVRLGVLKTERNRYRDNQTALMDSVIHYRTQAGTQAASVLRLELSAAELREQRADLTAACSQLRIRIRRLETAATTATKNQVEMQAPLRDSVVVRSEAGTSAWVHFPPSSLAQSRNREDAKRTTGAADGAFQNPEKTREAADGAFQNPERTQEEADETFQNPERTQEEADGAFQNPERTTGAAEEQTAKERLRHDTVRVFHWRDSWTTVHGVIDSAAVRCRVETIDTLRQIVHRVPRRFLFIRWGTKAIRQEIVSSNPHTRILYTEYIELKSRRKRQ